MDTECESDRYQGARELPETSHPAREPDRSTQ